MGIRSRAVDWAVGELKQRLWDAAWSRLRRRTEDKVRERTDQWIESRRDLYKDWEEEHHADSTDETS